MKRNIIFYLLAVLFGLSQYSMASTCDQKQKATGFSKINLHKGEKAYFYSDPINCVNNKLCTTKKKTYLLKDNFVQTAKIEGEFVCAIFRNYDGQGGKVTTGWLLMSDIATIRTKLEHQDLEGSWTQMPCDDGDDCGIEISEGLNKALVIEMSSHINDHPGSSINVSSVKEAKVQLNLMVDDSDGAAPHAVQIIFESNDLEPGTIKLIGLPTFNGIYRK